MSSFRYLLRATFITAAIVLPLWATYDRDGNGISDIWSALHPGANAPSADFDGDGKPNREEAIAGTIPDDPMNSFTASPERDETGRAVLRWTGILGKRYRIEYSTDLGSWVALSGEFVGADSPIVVEIGDGNDTDSGRVFWRVVVYDTDTDSDGLNDWEESQLGTNLDVADSDGDGLSDVAELDHGTDPLRLSSVGDGISDGWKIGHGLDAHAPGLAAADPDGDGRNNQVEYEMGSDPNDFFNGEAPLLVVVSGAEQTPVNGFLAQPIVLQVTHADGQPWSNAPVMLDVDFGPGLWARTVGEVPARQLILHTTSDGRVVAQYAFSLPDPAVPTGDIASATTGREPNQTKLQFLPVKAPVGTWDVWQEDFLFSSRVVETRDGAIGFQDLSMLPYPNKPTHGSQIRTYRKRDTHLHYAASWENGHLFDDQSISVRQGDDDVYLVSGTTRYSSVSGDSWTSGSGELLPAMELKINDPMPRSQLVISGSGGGNFSGVAFLLPGASSTPYGSYCREKDYGDLPSRFPVTPRSWSVDHATLSDSDGNTFEITLSEEDTVGDLRARFAQSKAIADAIADLPMGTDRAVRNGGAIIQDKANWAPDYPVIYLENLEEFGAAAPKAAYGRAEFCVSIPEDSFSRAAGASFRARFVVLFVPDESPDFPEVADVFECTLSPDNNWESPIYSITPEAGGYTDIFAWSMVAESSRPSRLLPGQVQVSAAGPMEYAGKKPEFAWEAMVPDPEADGPWRKVLQDTKTLQQVFLRDDYYSSLLSDMETSATWAPVPGSTVPVRLWCWHDDGSALGRWSLLPEGCDLKPYFNTSNDFLFLEALAPGFASARFTTSIGDASAFDDIRIDANVASPVLSVDANRDGQIKLPSEDDSDATSKDKPFRFWINDDDDSGDTGGDDVPGSYYANYITEPYGSGNVHGTRDLIDWFPVVLDIKQLLTVLPPSDSVKYKLKQADGALNFVYTNLTREHAFDYQRLPKDTEPLATGFGPDLNQVPGEASKWQITADGFDLFDNLTNGTKSSSAFLDAIQSHDGGVILVEGRRATEQPLFLVVEKDGTTIAEIKLELKISPVEQMYRHLNLRSGTDAPADALLAGNISRRNGDADRATNLAGPQGYPDTSADQPWFIFVVGSNVGGRSARGWESETFKRLYWSRDSSGTSFKSRFVGVSWFGDPYFNSTEQIYDYHMSVRNSFATASKLAQQVNALSGRKTIAGHSLGCGVIAAAIADYGMTVNQTCFVDAAIAREAFDGRAAGDETSASGVTVTVGMTVSIWRAYDPTFYAANWNERFASTPTDARYMNLTWRNRFSAAAGTITNFYSSTEDVLGRYDGEVPDNVVSAFLNAPSNVASYVWVYQEKAKGHRQDYYVWPSHVGSTYGGWGMNLKDPIVSGNPLYWKWVDNFNYIGRLIKTPTEIGTVSDSVLRFHPVFEPGWGQIGGQQQEIPVSNVSPVDNAPTWIYDLYQSSGGTHAADYAKRAQLLAEFVPALSLPMGSRAVNSTTIQLNRQHNSPAEFAAPGWPRGVDATTNVARWRHSDMREVAYLYQSKLWDTFVFISQQP